MKISLKNILLLDELQYRWKAVWSEKWKYLFLFLQIVILADMWKYSRSDSVLLLNCIFSFLLSIRKRLDFAAVAKVMGVFVLMCVPPIIAEPITELTFRQYVGFAIRLMTACFWASYFRKDFIVKFENIVFLLAYISLPLFLLQCINPHIFDIFTPISDAFMEGRRNYVVKDDPSVTQHQYILIYCLNGWALRRNSGFMWEPAAFGAMLSWALMFRIYLSRFRIEKCMLVYVIAILTTFSLGTYTYALVLTVLFLSKDLRWKEIGAVVIIGMITLFLFANTEFFSSQQQMMGDKVEEYQTQSRTSVEKRGYNYINEKPESKRVNRLAMFYTFGEALKEAPLGHGMNGFTFDSANGLGHIVVMWGISGILIMVIFSFAFTKHLVRFTFQKVPIITMLTTMAVLILPFVGNPFYNQVFILTLIVLPMFVQKQIYPNYYANRL